VHPPQNEQASPRISRLAVPILPSCLCMVSPPVMVKSHDAASECRSGLWMSRIACGQNKLLWQGCKYRRGSVELDRRGDVGARQARIS
jgi:hypothetical protein